MDTLLYKITDPEEQKEEIKRTAEILRGGGIAAIPTETVYGLAADAFNGEAVEKIFEAKGRPQDNPLIVHIADFEELYSLVSEVPEAAKKLAESFWPGPLTMILPKSSRVPDEVTAKLPTVAVRMPSHTVARAVIRAAGVPLAAPSANISGFPSPTRAMYVIDDMYGRIPVIIDGGDCEIGIESTVVALTETPPRVLRPGAVTEEMLREVLGDAEVDPSALAPLSSGSAPASPGMKYRHYSPKAEIFIVRGDRAEFARYAELHSSEADFVLCFSGEENDTSLPAVAFGAESDSLSQAHRLFDALRELDEKGASRVFARSPSVSGVGLGVCNRLYRAAGFRFLPVKRGKIIGVTGGSGAGKSTVCGFFAENGCEIVDADKISRQLLDNNRVLRGRLADTFGKDILSSDGSIDRKKLADRAFENEESKEKLDSLTHPEIVKRCAAAAEAAAAAGKTAVIDAPLLFSSGLDKICNITVKVYAPEEIRLKRISERDGICRDKIMKRFERQSREEELSRNADRVINNYPPFSAETQVREIIDAAGEKGRKTEHAADNR